jgi:ubiquinol-cytochrome c reductase cytochrome b subunit
MASGPRETFKNPVIEWIDSRLPVFTMMQKEYGVFPTPKNFNYFWNFGAIAMFMLITMIVTGIVLAMNYTPQVDMAFDSVERIMRDVNSGWLIRYIHMNGASFFFIAVYIHIFRGMYYGSYKKPRELLWIFGVLIFILMMATAFMGYVLPWGQMSYWGATVITNLFSAFPLVGESIVTWLWGGFSVDNPTLNRFFALHYLLPFVIFAVVFLHIWALHVTGSNNPLGIEPKGKQDTLPFHPYYTMKDTFGLLVFLIIFCAFVFFAPDYLGHPDNYKPADPLVTPAHIVPEWYFLPFYAMLRAVTFGVSIYIGLGMVFAVLGALPLYTGKKDEPVNFKRMLGFFGVSGIFLLLGYLSQLDAAGGGKVLSLPLGGFLFADAKLGGVCAMFGSLLVLLIMPWLDAHPIRSARFRPQYRFLFLFLVVVFVFLGYIGSQPADAYLGPVPLSILGLLGTGYYYAFFLVLLPFLARTEKGRALPQSIHEAVLQKDSKK